MDLQNNALFSSTWNDNAKECVAKFLFYLVVSSALER